MTLKILDFTGRRTTRSRCLENSIWKRVWSCLKIGYVVSENVLLINTLICNFVTVFKKWLNLTLNYIEPCEVNHRTNSPL